MAKVNLGDQAKDKVTGFEGVVVAVTTWLNGCQRFTVQPQKLDKDGKIRESQCFDDHQLEVTKRNVVTPHPTTEQQQAASATEETTSVTSMQRTGGPCNDKAALRR